MSPKATNCLSRWQSEFEFGEVSPVAVTRLHRSILIRVRSVKSVARSSFFSHGFTLIDTDDAPPAGMFVEMVALRSIVSVMNVVRKPFALAHFSVRPGILDKFRFRAFEVTG